LFSSGCFTTFLNIKVILCLLLLLPSHILPWRTLPFPEPLHLGQGPGVGRDSAGGVPLCLCGHDLVDPFSGGTGSHQARRTEWLGVAGRCCHGFAPVDGRRKAQTFLLDGSVKPAMAPDSVLRRHSRLMCFRLLAAVGPPATAGRRRLPEAPSREYDPHNSRTASYLLSIKQHHFQFPLRVSPRRSIWRAMGPCVPGAHTTESTALLDRQHESVQSRTPTTGRA
jgi:hypothetical protein